MDNFLGEIRPFAFNFAPSGWALCNGQLLPISQYTALFSLLGTYYGGDGRTNFALPNLQGGIVNAQGQGAGLSTYAIGQTGGQPTVTLISSQIASHTHTLPASSSTSPKQNAPSPSVFLGATGERGSELPVYATSTSTTATMLAAAVQPAGGQMPHNNMGPYVVINFCIATQGIFPQRQ